MSVTTEHRDRPHLRPVDPVEDLGRTPPQDLDAEMAVLGACMLSKTALEDVLDTIEPTDFYRPAHELIHAAAEHLYINGDPVDTITVAHELERRGELGRAGGATYLQTCISATPTTANAGYYADIVREKARLRRLIEAGTKIVQLGYTSTGGDVDDLVTAAHTEITSLPAATLTKNHAGDTTYLDFHDLFTNPGSGVTWLVPPFLADGRITLLYSPGKVGKSLIAMEAAAALATGRPTFHRTTETDPLHVLYIDQEMTREDWHDRLTDMGYTLAHARLLATHLHLANLQAWPPLDTPAGGQAVLREVQATGARVVIIDTASKVTAGEENSNDTQQNLYRCTLAPLKRAGIATLVLDHTGKDLERGARGGSAKTDNVDLAFKLTLRTKDRLIMACTHARFRDPLCAENTHLHRTEQPLRHVVEARPALTDDHGPGMRPTYLMEKVSRYVEANPGATRNMIESARLGKSAEYVRMGLDLLVVEGFIEAKPGERRGQHHTSVLPYRDERKDEE